MLDAFINEMMPITGVRVLGGKVFEVVRTPIFKPSNKGSKRGKVKTLSRQSIRRLAVMVALSEVKFFTMMTLTYPSQFPMNGKTSKAHLNRFLTWLRRRYKDVSYLWFLEFQRRQAPHYHILTSVPEGEVNRGDMARYWAQCILKTGGPDWWEVKEEFDKVVSVHSHRRAWEKIRANDNGVRYLLKYAAKQEQKSVPDGFVDVGRFWGSSQDVPNDCYTVEEYDIDDGTLRANLIKSGIMWGDWKVIPKYIFIPSEVDDHEPDE